MDFEQIEIDGNVLHDAHVWVWIRECWLADEPSQGPLMRAEAYFYRNL